MVGVVISVVVDIRVGVVSVSGIDIRGIEIVIVYC